MIEEIRNRPVSVRDLITGTVMIVVGLVAYFEALSFDEASRLFPAVTAGLLVATGLGVAFHAFFKPASHERRLHAIRTPLLAALVIAAWAVAITRGGGFIFPTFLMQLALFLIAGIRNWKMLLSIAALIAALAYLLFVVLLDVPIPASRFSTVLLGF